MNYDDFPILNNHDYELLNNYYSNKTNTNKNEIILSLCNSLSNCINSCTKSDLKYNRRILDSINNLKQVLIKTNNNLTSYFNIKLSPNKEIYNISIFQLLNNITFISEYFLEWFSIEEKEYYKNLIIRSLKEISLSTKKVFIALDESFINFYKFM